jgi:Thioredoxin-like
MMKHRGGSSSSSSEKDIMVLPLTQVDVVNGTSSVGAVIAVTTHNQPGTAIRRVRRLRKKKTTGSAGESNGAMWGFGTLLSFILAAGLLTAFVQQHVIAEQENNDGTGSSSHVERLIVQEKWPTLQEDSVFPSLQYALQHSDIVLLYFAAAWCPMSTPVTKLVDELFSPLLLPPPRSDDETAEKARDLEKHHQQLDNGTKRYGKKISLVYISSDQTAAEMERYKKPNWMVVPFFDKNDERAKIKRHFKTCAKREMPELHMSTRQHEIPTLIVLAGNAGGNGVDSIKMQRQPLLQVLTFHGIKDIKQAVAEAEAEADGLPSLSATADDIAQSLIDSWMELKRLSNSLTDKFFDEE